MGITKQGLFYDVEDKFIEIKRKIKEQEELFIRGKNITLKFLQACQKEGIRLVAIEAECKRIKSSVDFPFGTGGSVFADKQNKDERPAIWTVVEKVGISGGAGNGGQHQITSAELISGVYELKNGKWRFL